MHLQDYDITVLVVAYFHMVNPAKTIRQHTLQYQYENGQAANYHKYQVSNGVEIQEIEVKF